MYAVCGGCYTRHMLHLGHAVQGICCTWCMPYSAVRYWGIFHVHGMESVTGHEV